MLLLLSLWLCGQLAFEVVHIATDSSSLAADKKTSKVGVLTQQHKEVMLIMQIKGLPRNLLRLNSYAERHPDISSPEAVKVTFWEHLKSEGVSDKACADIVGISRPTFYRYRRRIQSKQSFKNKPRRINRPQWGESEKQRVLEIRRKTGYGKFKIAIILKRDYGLELSESTVGRILNHLSEKGLITRSTSSIRRRRKRQFNRHAKAWSYKKYQDMVLGERVQIDHMTVTKNGITVKHFQAWERKSRHISACVYAQATSRSAKRFLKDLVEQAPYPINSIQVDGGSEFMADFEQACENLGIPLIVLPPSKPQYNGGVERTNRTLREEFYDKASLLADSIGAMRNELRKAINRHNTYRPHHSLKGQTPMEYITSLSNSEVSALSQNT